MASDPEKERGLKGARALQMMMRQRSHPHTYCVSIQPALFRSERLMYVITAAGSAVPLTRRMVVTLSLVDVWISGDQPASVYPPTDLVGKSLDIPVDWLDLAIVFRPLSLRATGASCIRTRIRPSDDLVRLVLAMEARPQGWPR